MITTAQAGSGTSHRPTTGLQRQKVQNALVIGLTAAAFAALGWHHRWMADDGLIVLRTVRNLLDGNGPVFNAGERVETNTSPLWTYVLVLPGLVPGVRLEWVAVGTGLIFSTLGIFLALDGARRVLATTGRTVIVPAGALVYCALPPSWDYVTSGLETGLSVLWMCSTWWLLVRLATQETARWPWWSSVVLGLGPLVRPELAVFSACAFGALLVLARPGWRRGATWLAITVLAPVSYQMFRMSYYGLLTPNTALAKEAFAARWHAGWRYLLDLVQPYLLSVPVVLLGAAAAVAFPVSALSRRVTVVTVFPVLTGAVLLVYLTRLGGDYMHGRSLLPVLLCFCLPVFLLPLTRWTAVPLAFVGLWALIAIASLRSPCLSIWCKYGISDSHSFWVQKTGHAHPITAMDAAERQSRLPALEKAKRNMTGPTVGVTTDSAKTERAYPAAHGQPSTILTSSLGFPSMLIPLDQRVVDDIGLANPLAAHTFRIPGKAMGHDKRLKDAWGLAESAAGTPEQLSAMSGDSIHTDEIAAARHALHCPDIVEMLNSVRAPLSIDRLWKNATGAFQRTSLRYDRDPKIAQTCGHPAQ